MQLESESIHIVSGGNIDICDYVNAWGFVSIVFQ